MTPDEKHALLVKILDELREQVVSIAIEADLYDYGAFEQLREDIEAMETAK
jgi:hypothetical protein